MTGRYRSNVEEFASPPSRAASNTLARWNEPCTVTLYSEASADATVRINVPVRDVLPHVGLVTKTSGGVEFTLYVQLSPTCHVGALIDDACGVFVPGGEPNFARFAGPNATAATAMPTNANVIATKPKGLIRIPFLLFRSGEERPEYKG